MDSSSSNILPVDSERKIRHLSVEAQQAFQQFRRSGEAAALDPLILAILESYGPRRGGEPLSALAGTTRLAEDLGFDSLAIAEVVFFTEDLFEISITNEEILEVRTLDDLRRFIRAKVVARGTT